VKHSHTLRCQGRHIHGTHYRKYGVPGSFICIQMETSTVQGKCVSISGAVKRRPPHVVCAAPARPVCTVGTLSVSPAIHASHVRATCGCKLGKDERPPRTPSNSDAKQWQISCVWNRQCDFGWETNTCISVRVVAPHGTLAVNPL